MSRHNVCCQSSDTEKRIFCPTEVIRIEKRIEIKNKDYVPCSTCKSYLLYSSAIVDEKGNSIPLDINGKRHFCNVVQRLAFVNKVEFSSVHLGIVSVTDQVS